MVRFVRNPPHSCFVLPFIFPPAQRPHTCKYLSIPTHKPRYLKVSRRCSRARAPFQARHYLFAFPSSQQGRSFYQSARNHRVSGVCRAYQPDPGAPWPISGWPHGRNPGSWKLQKHKNLQNFLNLFGTRRKVVGKDRFSLVDFLPEVRKWFWVRLFEGQT